MIMWVFFLVLQLMLAVTALVTSDMARRDLRFGCDVLAETHSTIAYCSYIILGAIFFCQVGSGLNTLGLVMIIVWILLAYREWRFASYLSA